MSTESANNKPGGADSKGGGLQKVDRQAALASLRQPVGDVVDLHELAPVMESFRAHMAQEQERNRRRLRALGLAFGIALCVLVVVPVYVIRAFVHSSRTQMDAQMADQEKLTQSLSDGMTALAAQSQQLQNALEKERAMRIAAATSAPPAIAPTIVVTALVSQIVFTPMPAPPPQIQPAPVPVPTPPTTGETPVVREPPVAPPTAMATVKISDIQFGDLKSMLDQVEQVIAKKRGELDARRSAAKP